MTPTTDRARGVASDPAKERALLTQFLARLTRVHVRAVESPTSALLPDGRRLRGIFIFAGCHAFVFGRDLQWYAMERSEERATPVTLDEVLAVVSAPDLARGLNDAWTRAQTHHKVRRASRRPIWRR